MAHLSVNFEVKLDGDGSFAAFCNAARLVQRITEEQPWNEDAKEALAEMQKAAKGLKLQVRR